MGVEGTSFDPLKVKPNTIGSQVWEHEQRLYDLTELVHEMAVDIKAIRLCVTRLDRTNNALWSKMEYDAKSTLAALDLRDDRA